VCFLVGHLPVWQLVYPCFALSHNFALLKWRMKRNWIWSVFWDYSPPIILAIFKCIRQPSIARILAPLLFISNLLIVICLLTEWFDFTEDDHLFHGLFKDAIKEETYLTDFENNLDCLSDEDKEGPFLGGIFPHKFAYFKDSMCG
jgi:hypothetical protein